MFWLHLEPTAPGPRHTAFQTHRGKPCLVAGPGSAGPWIGWALACAVVAAGCGQQTVPEASAPAGKPSRSPSESPSASPSDEAPTLLGGWRWESYGGVEVGVPGDWGWGNGDQRLGQWCVDQGHQPIVGRPGVSTLVGCGFGAEGDPGTLLENTGMVVALGDVISGTHASARDDGKAVRREEGDRLTVTLDGVVVQIQAEKRLREQVAATIHLVDVDAYGCPTYHPITRDASLRLAGPVDVNSLTGVTAVSACKYSLPQPNDPRADRGALISSLRLQGEAAAVAMERVAAAATGGGPDEPSSCMGEYSHGDDAIVLLVTSGQGESEVYLRYSGCDHNGFDDGTTVRRSARSPPRPSHRSWQMATR